MKKCNVKECHAACCYNVPMSRGYLSAYRKKIVNPILRVESEGFDDVVIPWTNNDSEKNKCPFLRSDCRCNIYQSRPNICRIFGDGKLSRFLNCEYITGVPNKMGVKEVDDAVFDMFRNKRKIKI